MRAGAKRSAPTPRLPIWELSTDNWWRVVEVNVLDLVRRADEIKEHDLYVLRLRIPE